MNGITLNTIEEAIEDIRQGRILIVVDDEDRENEGDFICAAELITPEIVNFMAKYGRGLICAALPEERCEELELDLMVGINTSLHETQFTVSVDLLGNETSTGVSAKDRALTIKALVDPNTKPSDLGRPGHIFPLKARSKGVLRRAGHTEAVVDLTRMAGLKPGGALVEIMNDDGSMARLPELFEMSKKFGIKIIAIRDLIRYRLERESIIERGERVKLPTTKGEFEFIPFRQVSNGLEHAALVKGTWTKDEPVLVRVHSSCFTGDVFHSLRCDCGQQLDKAMEMVEKEGKGVIIYLSQEGRGIGLVNKIKTYKLQEKGLDTVQANLKLGFREDERDYGVGASIMRELGLGRIILISNNPVKRAGLEGYGIKIVDTIPLVIEPNPYNEFYLKTKADKMGHDFSCYKHGLKD
ncbi:MAG TPA: bifunctional 3,4-dihydroxy-2-butanone-4-phosphate synthase/GTP cyclohydrolase II [Bacteroidales bacterium]|nr:bifunctional 3,4-dihydroxy-2-butanone-4-phosphate synthase/GTP cyclohydrolase II [Bacteroidales bacterium]HRR92821.1 bifunctional 3,4-dihydroxy-2-butanone-4-phosphate synthase/GTP cyclohydrolase II [Bacteroidales bacterium]HRT90717.1 bifunctional 3,4-dihydroxy-2-butanone-4-phosphate synthase/GTP cyclohydrolase II [Bacteroidales bacterium]